MLFFVLRATINSDLVQTFMVGARMKSKELGLMNKPKPCKRLGVMVFRCL